MIVFLAVVVLLLAHLDQRNAIYVRLVKRLWLAHLSVPPVLLALTRQGLILVVLHASLGFTPPQQDRLHVEVAMLVNGLRRGHHLVLNVLPVTFHSMLSILARCVQLVSCLPLLAPLPVPLVHRERTHRPAPLSAPLVPPAPTRSSASGPAPTVRLDCTPDPVRLYAVHALPGPLRSAGLPRV